MADQYDRWQLASQSRLSLTRQRQLAQDTDKVVRARLAENPALALEVQQRLLQDETYVRFHLARNRALGRNIQLALAQDAHAIVRQNLAENPILALSIVQWLALDLDMGVRLAIADTHPLGRIHISKSALVC